MTENKDDTTQTAPVTLTPEQQARLRRRNRTLGDLGGGARHMGAAILRGARAGHGTGEENLSVHG